MSVTDKFPSGAKPSLGKQDERLRIGLVFDPAQCFDDDQTSNIDAEPDQEIYFCQ